MRYHSIDIVLKPYAGSAKSTDGEKQDKKAPVQRRALRKKIVNESKKGLHILLYTKEWIPSY
jgi:hypothetical protein